MSMARTSIYANPSLAKEFTAVTIIIEDIPYGFLNVIKDYIGAHPDINQNSVTVRDYSTGRSKIFRPDLQLLEYNNYEALRDYQNKVARMITTTRRCLAVSMTGSGKTVIMTHVLKHYDYAYDYIMSPKCPDSAMEEEDKKSHG